MSKAIKVLITLIKSKEGRKLLKKIMIIILSPLIILMLLFSGIGSATAEHNNNLIEVLFHNQDISESTPDDYKNDIHKIKDYFNDIDVEIGKFESTKGRFDNTLIKSILLSYMINNSDHNIEININEYLQNFYTVTNESKEATVVVLLDINEILSNVSNYFDYDLFSHQEEINELYNVALTGSSKDMDQYVPMNDLLKDLYDDSEKSKLRGDMFVSPFESDWINHVTSEFGSRTPIILPDGTATDSYHTGIDLSNKLGTPIRSIATGKVVIVRHTNIGLGLFVVIDHGGGLFSVYGHMSRIYVLENDELLAGDVIGEVGSSGYSTGPHLHLEIIENRKNINPRIYLK